MKRPTAPEKSSEPERLTRLTRSWAETRREIVSKSCLCIVRVCCLFNTGSMRLLFGSGTDGPSMSANVKLCVSPLPFRVYLLYRAGMHAHSRYREIHQKQTLNYSAQLVPIRCRVTQESKTSIFFRALTTLSKNLHWHCVQQWLPVDTKSPSTNTPSTLTEQREVECKFGRFQRF